MTEVSAPEEKPSGGRQHAVESGSEHSAHIVALVEQLLAHVAHDTRPDPGLVLDVRQGPLRCLVVRETRAILSPRELEIAAMVAQGHPTKRIASTLDISSFTVSSHLRRIFVKLGVTSRPAMVAQLSHHGIVDLGGRTDPDLDLAWEQDDERDRPHR